MEKRREIGCQPYDVTVITTDATDLRRRTATYSTVFSYIGYVVIRCIPIVQIGGLKPAER